MCAEYSASKPMVYSQSHRLYSFVSITNNLNLNVHYLLRQIFSFSVCIFHFANLCIISTNSWCLDFFFFICHQLYSDTMKRNGKQKMGTIECILRNALQYHYVHFSTVEWHDYCFYFRSFFFLFLANTIVRPLQL